MKKTYPMIVAPWLLAVVFLTFFGRSAHADDLSAPTPLPKERTFQVRLEHGTGGFHQCFSAEGYEGDCLKIDLTTTTISGVMVQAKGPVSAFLTLGYVAEGETAVYSSREGTRVVLSSDLGGVSLGLGVGVKLPRNIHLNLRGSVEYFPTTPMVVDSVVTGDAEVAALARTATEITTDKFRGCGMALVHSPTVSWRGVTPTIGGVICRERRPELAFTADPIVGLIDEGRLLAKARGMEGSGQDGFLTFQVLTGLEKCWGRFCLRGELAVAPVWGDEGFWRGNVTASYVLARRKFR